MANCGGGTVAPKQTSDQQDALFTFSIFQQLTSTCFEQAYCSSSGCTTLYIQQLVCHALMLTGSWLLEIVTTGKEVFNALTNALCGYFLQHTNLLSERPANIQASTSL